MNRFTGYNMYAVCICKMQNAKLQKKAQSALMFYIQIIFHRCNSWFLMRFFKSSSSLIQCSAQAPFWIVWAIGLFTMTWDIFFSRSSLGLKLNYVKYSCRTHVKKTISKRRWHTIWWRWIIISWNIENTVSSNVSIDYLFRSRQIIFFLLLFFG